ncbi:hypothetical protein L566_1102 [Bordetella pertussis CHLA-26]|uniref:Uncharacterized protein n=1 Tax=Bordetella pertussis CHLA-26 TaxID=1331284 RepID=A0AAI9NGZ7_BORPT|nr:hypothetical protein L575_2610 [Bordetella pertussis STO1-SEAT-0007]ETH32923.1 hypothetical protein L566_1102 [Bordetella pertussis CHLA-26]ETH85213.1 hypothetical protein L560_1412 [Bordetella pertussis STO1-CHOC-0018]KDB74622.1 hypothetical protein AZ21_1975 [Bordetella bronchiseptica B20-10725633]
MARQCCRRPRVCCWYVLPWRGRYRPKGRSGWLRDDWATSEAA